MDLQMKGHNLTLGGLIEKTQYVMDLQARLVRCIIGHQLARVAETQALSLSL